VRLKAWILAPALAALSLGAADIAHAPRYTVVYRFTGGADGAGPEAPVILDSTGNIYGTALYPFTGTACAGSDCGVVFKLDPAGNFTVLHSFTGGADGGYPQAGLTMDSAGNIYGTTDSGGQGQCANGGCGVVFKLDTGGNFTVLHSFTGGADGAGPASSGVIQGPAGYLFGTTSGGGAYNHGVVFKLGPDGTLSVLHNFTGGADGSEPWAGVVGDGAGNLYGTTARGGGAGCTGGCGVVFKLDPSGNLTVLHTFYDNANGALPYAGVIRDSAGNLYGTAARAGSSGCFGYGCGVVYKVDPAGALTILHTFTASIDGGNSYDGVIRDAAGNLYGTTSYGGRAGCFGKGCGVVFKLDPAGTYTVLYEFTGGADGGTPYAGLTSYRNSIYGTASGGGISGMGVVFKIP